MAKSLQEQLMGAGLVDKKKAKDIQKEKRTKRKQTPKGQQHVDENKARIEQQKLEKAAKDRALNKQQQEEKERKAIKAQIKQLILVNEIKRDESADESFQFVVDNKIICPGVDDNNLLAGPFIGKIIDRIGGQGAGYGNAIDAVDVNILVCPG